MELSQAPRAELKLFFSFLLSVAIFGCANQKKWWILEKEIGGCE
jgi:hypothetical protein